MLSISCCAGFALYLPGWSDLPVLTEGLVERRLLPWAALSDKFQQVAPSYVCSAMVAITDDPTE